MPRGVFSGDAPEDTEEFSAENPSALPFVEGREELFMVWRMHDPF